MMVEQSLTFVIALVVLFARMLTQSETDELRRERLEALEACQHGAVLDPRRPAHLDDAAHRTSAPNVTSPSTTRRSHSISDGGPVRTAARSPRPA